MYQSRWAPAPEVNEEQSSPPIHSSSLSAVAPTFSPAPPPPDVSSVDYFAQTGASQDDLFDGITPVDDSMRLRSEDDLFSDDFTPVTRPVAREPTPQKPAGRADASRGRGRERGRANGASAKGGMTSSAATQTAEPNGQVQTVQEVAPGNAPSGPRNDTTSAVRGDRQATGGVRKPKLTEEELAEKMARIQIKNASLTAAHARAEADAASFTEREQQAKHRSSQQQKVERKDRQQMMGERERNRMRKLKAMEGREWDVEKNEDDFAKGGRFDGKGGFGGDQQDYTDGREYMYRDPRGGGRRAQGVARGGRVVDQSAPRQDEFPALPPSSKPDLMSQRSTDASNAGAGKSWADQVESSNPS